MKRHTVRKSQSRRGQGLIEYIIIIASVAFISLVALSMFGHKVSDQYAIASGMLPGAHEEDNFAIQTGFFAETQVVDGNTTGNGRVSWGFITGDEDGNGSLENNVVAGGFAVGTGDAFVGEDE